MSELTDALERALREIRPLPKVAGAEPVKVQKKEASHLSRSLYYKKGSSDKEYHIQIMEHSSGLYHVTFQYGRCGSRLQRGTKTDHPTSLDQAKDVFNEVLNEKLKKGYKEL